MVQQVPREFLVIEDDRVLSRLIKGRTSWSAKARPSRAPAKPS